MEITNEQIAEKLRQVEEFEAKWGENLETRAWRKWCTDERYRQREQQLREAVAEAIEDGYMYRIGEQEYIKRYSTEE